MSEQDAAIWGFNIFRQHLDSTLDTLASFEGGADISRRIRLASGALTTKFKELYELVEERRTKEALAVKLWATFASAADKIADMAAPGRVDAGLIALNQIYHTFHSVNGDRLSPGVDAQMKRIIHHLHAIAHPPMERRR